MRTASLTITLSFFAPLAAQDMIGVAFSGSIYAFDSHTGAGNNIGSGLFGQNALGYDGQGRLWSTTRTATQPFVYGLSIVDPFAVNATQVFPGVDLRGMAGSGGNFLWATQDNASTDSLVAIDVTTGAVTPIGPTGRSSIQALALHNGVLYAWDLGAGLMTVDMATGLATDVNPAVGTTGTEVQWLCSHSDGRLLAGRNDLFSLDPLTGVATLVANIGAGVDLRGAEQWGGGSIQRFGQGCNGPFGPIALTVTGIPSPNNTLTFSSGQHATGVLGILILGTSNSTYGGLPLPFSVDPIVGTIGCSLLVSADATVLGFTSAATGALTFNLALPPNAANRVFHVQHAAFDPVPGSMSWSNGATVRVGP